MKTTRERAFEPFKSALKKRSIPSPTFNGAEAVLREILGLELSGRRVSRCDLLTSKSPHRV